MGLPWPEWGETDVALTGALHHLDAMTCGCGCGQPVDIAHDEDYSHRWQIEILTCHAGGVLSEFRRRSGEKLEPGQMPYVRLLAPDEDQRDPLAFDAEYARREYERHMASLGLDG